MALNTTSVEHVRRMVHDRWGSLVDEVNEAAAERDESGSPVPVRFYRAAGELGLTGYTMPRQFGGEGGGPFVWGLIVEHLGYLCEDTAFPLVMSFQPEIAKIVIEYCAEPAVERYAVPLGRGERIGGLAYTEDADAFSMSGTTIVAHDGGLVVRGRKSFSGPARVSDHFITFASDGTGDLAGVLVDAAAPGVEVTPVDTIGYRSIGGGSVTFQEVVVPDVQIVSRTDGLTPLNQLLNAARITIACGPLGRAQALFEHCVERLNQTVRQGAPLAEMPNVQARVGRMYVALESARAVLYQALIRMDEGSVDPVFDPSISVAKYLVTEKVNFVVDCAFRLMGGYSYYGDRRFGQALRDFKGGMLAAGTQDLLEINLGALALAGRPLRRKGAQS
ncbi:acyl-CoA dehydrogenase family protein [Streptomyces poriticola]|uniref:acyl-CoA dehydrogenase family protein n=1 Tax=Streptomyces poriticola TaxID=3120506 RepID=UPI002FCDF74B